MSPVASILDSPPPEKILVRGVNWLGDAIMTIPALIRLREAHPNALVSILTSEKLADVWKLFPFVNQVLTFREGESPFAIGRRLKPENFDIGLALPNSPRSAIELWAAAIPRRFGARGLGRGIFLTDSVPLRKGGVTMKIKSVAEIEKSLQQPGRGRKTFPASSHHVYHYLHLVSALGANPAPVAPCLKVNEDDIAAAQKKFKIDTAIPWIGINPGADYGPAKRWPLDRFAIVIRELQNRTICQCLIFGGPGDVDLAARLLNEPSMLGCPKPARNLAGATGLRDFCALLKSCALLLTNDSGPMHLAAALGVPVAVPFGSTSPELTGPRPSGGGNDALIISSVPCAPCFRRECPIDFRCMNGISSSEMVDAILRVLPPNLRNAKSL